MNRQGGVAVLPDMIQNAEHSAPGDLASRLNSHEGTWIVEQAVPSSCHFPLALSRWPQRSGKLDLLRAIEQLLGPTDVMNPGKVIP